ncbi:hypothetical protein V6N13_092661 [Hibiscus sabdariffa]
MTARYTKKGLLQKKGVLAGVIVSSAVVFLILVIFLRCWVQRQRRAERTRKGKNIVSFTTFEDSLLGENEIDESTRNGDVPYFDLSTIAAATNNFSSDNKLGQGGFGPVYKVWELWKEGKAMEVIDSTLGGLYSTEEMLKCIQIGLLCVQEHATHSPRNVEMHSNWAVVSMLINEATLPSPEQPAFIEKKSHESDEVSSSEGAKSVNVSITMIQAR